MAIVAEMKTTQEKIAETRAASPAAPTFQELMAKTKVWGAAMAEGIDTTFNMGEYFARASRGGNMNTREAVEQIFGATIDEQNAANKFGKIAQRDSKGQISKLFTFVRVGSNAKLPADYVPQCLAMVNKVMTDSKVDLSRYEALCKLNRDHETRDSLMSEAEVAQALAAKPKAAATYIDRLEALARSVEKTAKEFPLRDLTKIAKTVKAELDCAKIEASEAHTAALKAAYEGKEKESLPMLPSPIGSGNSHSTGTLN